MKKFITLIALLFNISIINTICITPVYAATPLYLNNSLDWWGDTRDPTNNEIPTSGEIRINNFYMNTATGYIWRNTSAVENAMTWQKLIPQVQSDWNESNTAAIDYILNKPAITTPNINDTPGRSLVTSSSATGFQLSATRYADVRYSATITTTSTIGGNSNGYILVEKAATNSTTPADWAAVARIPSGQNNTVIVGVSLQQYGGGQANATIQPGYYVRIRSVNVAGTPTYTLNEQEEVLR